MIIKDIKIFSQNIQKNNLIVNTILKTKFKFDITVVVPIVEEYVQTKKCTIIKDSDKEHTFIKEIIKSIKNINTADIGNIACLDNIVNKFTNLLESIWTKNSKVVNIMVHSKNWWDANCSRDLNIYRSSKRLEDWKQFKRIVKNTKCSFFNLKIQEITNKKHGPWELMNWVHKHKLPAIKTVKYNRQPCLKINNLWHTLHLSFNKA